MTENTAYTSWMSLMGITDADIAKRVGVDRSHAYRVRKGIKAPSLALACKIARMSFNKVPVESWVPEEELALT